MSFDPDEDSDDGAATALFVAPKSRSEGSTKPEAPVPPRPAAPSEVSISERPTASRLRAEGSTMPDAPLAPTAVPSEVSISDRQRAPRLLGLEELSEEELTSIRSVDIVISPSLMPPENRSILPSTPGALQLFAEMDAASAKTSDAESTAPMPASLSKTPTPPPGSQERSTPDPNESPGTQPKAVTPASSPTWETLSPPPRANRRLVSVLALSLVGFFLVIAGLLISQVRDEPSPASEAKPVSEAKSSPDPDPLGSSAVAIGAVRSAVPSVPDAAASAKPKK